MSQIKKLINQKFLEGIDSTKFHVAQNGAIMAKDSSGSMVEFLKVNSDSKGVVLGKVISTKDELDAVIADLAQEILDRQAGDLDAKAYADQKIADLINGAPALLDTLKELADAIANDENFAATIGGQIGQLQSDLATEIARAQAAELALSGRLDIAETDIDALEGRATSLEGRMTSAETDIVSLEGRMDLAEGAIGELQSDLAQEILDRQAGDEQSLQDAKDYADSKVLEEKGLREAADVQVLVDAKAYTDAEVSEEMSRAEGIENLLRSDLNAEIQSRVDGDAALGDEIDAERDARIAEDALKVSKEGDTMTGPLDITFSDGTFSANVNIDGDEGIYMTGSDSENPGFSASGFMYRESVGFNFGSEEEQILKNSYLNAGWMHVQSSTPEYSSATEVNHDGFEYSKTDNAENFVNYLKVDESGFKHIFREEDVEYPVMPASDFHMTSKKYVDDQDASKVQESKDYTDSKMAEEVTAREQGDANTLQSSKDYTDAEVLEEKNRAEGVEAGLQSSIEAEVQNRIDAMAQEVLDRNAAILVEKERAELAEAGLQSSINVEKGRIDAILDASQADKDSFAEIVSLINSVDTENDNAFAGYVLSNNAALAQEVSDRQTGDSALQTSLEAEVTRAMAAEGVIAEDLADEVSRAQGAEGVLQSNIDAEAVTRATADTTLQGNINSEQSAREQADIALGGRIDSAEASIASLSSTKADKSYVDTQDAGLQSQIDGLDGRLDIIEGADTVEGSVAKAEKDAKDYADSKFAEVQSNLDDVEGYAQDVRDDLDAEIARAVAAEGALDDRLDILEAMAFYKESKQVGSGDLSYVELAKEAKPYSIKVYVGRLALHEGQDFSVSVVGGKSRLTWMGDFMVGGVEEIEEGMKLFFEYYC